MSKGRFFLLLGSLPKRKSMAFFTTIQNFNKAVIPRKESVKQYVWPSASTVYIIICRIRIDIVISVWYHDIICPHHDTGIGRFLTQKKCLSSNQLPDLRTLLLCRLMENNKIEKMPEKVFAKMANLATL